MGIKEKIHLNLLIFITTPTIFGDFMARYVMLFFKKSRWNLAHANMSFMPAITKGNLRQLLIYKYFPNIRKTLYTIKYTLTYRMPY